MTQTMLGTGILVMLLGGIFYTSVVSVGWKTAVVIFVGVTGFCFLTALAFHLLEEGAKSFQ